MDALVHVRPQMRHRLRLHTTTRRSGCRAEESWRMHQRVRISVLLTVAWRQCPGPFGLWLTGFRREGTILLMVRTSHRRMEAELTQLREMLILKCR
uniref:Uncharacterized protein n=1 Tax=Rhizophora mucronata TaxID=61149 RepID=A0A2P2P7Q6_RHIMU